MQAKTYALDHVNVVFMWGSGFTALEQTSEDPVGFVRRLGEDVAPRLRALL